MSLSSARFYTRRLSKSISSADYSRFQRVQMFRFVLAAIFLTLATFSTEANAQNLQSRAGEIRAAMDARDFERAERLARDLRASDQAAFARNNYDYLLARLAERRGAKAEASSLYLGLINRNSNLSQYAIWHLAAIARASSDLALERQYLARLLSVYSSSAPVSRARD